MSFIAANNRLNPGDRVRFNFRPWGGTVLGHEPTYDDYYVDIGGGKIEVMHSSLLTRDESEDAIEDLWREYEASLTGHKKTPPRCCDCGAEKCNTTHADWCSLNSKEKK